MNKIFSNNILIKLILVFFCLFTSLELLADDTRAVQSDNLSWGALSHEQRKILRPFAVKWPELSVKRKHLLLKGVRRWKTMTPEQRENARGRLKRWQNMDEAKREHVRKRYERFKALPEDERKIIRQKMRWFRSLPKDKRRALRNRWEKMTPLQREHFKNKVIKRQKMRREILRRLSPSEKQKLRRMSRPDRIRYIRRWKAQRH